MRRHGRGPHQLLGRPDLQPALVKAPAEAGTVKDRTDASAAEVGARASQPDDADYDAGQPNGQNQQSSIRGNRGVARGRGGRLRAGALRNPSEVETGGRGEMNGENVEGWKVPITSSAKPRDKQKGK